MRIPKMDWRVSAIDNPLRLHQQNMRMWHPWLRYFRKKGKSHGDARGKVRNHQLSRFILSSFGDNESLYDEFTSC